MTTYVPSKNTIERRWHVVDADGVVLGRLSTEVARRLMGKSKATYVPFLDSGDHVVVINAARVRLTGRKLERKEYIRHSGYPGGLKRERAGDVKQKAPQRLVLEAVKGMLPKTKLGRAMLTKLRVYAGADHPHAAQAPQPLVIAGKRGRAAAAANR